MAPRLLGAIDIYGYVPILHAGVGISAMLLGTFFAVNFIRALQTNKPLTCGTKNMMRLALILLILPVFSGTLMYATFYM